MPQVQANDFRRAWETVGPDALSAVERVGRSGWLVLGEEVRTFEAELAEWWGIRHAVGVASGLDAIEIALRCAGILPGDKVLTTPLTAFATTLGILRAGAVPVWCDVDESGGLDLSLADAALAADPSIRALVPVHLYGHPLDPTELRALGARHGVVTVEDCAQSVGARRADRPTGTCGLAAATSFYPTKNLGALGDGGALLTDDDAVAEQARALRDYGQSSRYHHDRLGLNSRLDELHAAVLRSAMLPRLSRWLDRRAEIARRLADGIQGMPGVRVIAPAAGRSAHHLFPIEVTEGDPGTFAGGLAAAGIATGRHYPFVCPDQPAATGAGETLGTLPVARRLADRELSLPIHPFLEDPEVDQVIAAVRSACDR